MADIFDIFKKLERGRTATATTGPVTHLVVGLGNPGKEYRVTRHNAGFLCMDTICERYGATTDRSKFKSLVGEATIAGTRVLLMRPQTYMNSSGSFIGSPPSILSSYPMTFLWTWAVCVFAARARTAVRGACGASLRSWAAMPSPASVSAWAKSRIPIMI